MSEEAELRKKAEKRAKDKVDFYGHFAAWAVINIIIFITWVFTGRDQPGVPYFIWPLCIWGFFVFLHFIRAFVTAGSMEDRIMEKELAKLRK